MVKAGFPSAALRRMCEGGRMCEGALAVKAVQLPNVGVLDI